MTYNPYSTKWISVQCPICKEALGWKSRTEIKSFVCKTDGCSQTEHTFYPGQIKRPERSRPWAEYYDGKRRCSCLNCQSTTEDS